MPLLKKVDSLSEICIESFCFHIEKFFSFLSFKSGELSQSKEEDLKNEGYPEDLRAYLEKFEINNYELFHKDKVSEEELSYYCQSFYCIDQLHYLSKKGRKWFVNSIFENLTARLCLIYRKQQNKNFRHIIRKMIATFLNPSLIEFDFGKQKMFTELEMFKELYNNLEKAKYIEKLSFGRACIWRRDHMLNFDSLLVRFDKLKTLNVEYICNQALLESISNACCNLQELSIKGATEVNDQHVNLITKLIKLTVLNISGTSVTADGCNMILNELKNLYWLTHCPFNCQTYFKIFESKEELRKEIEEDFLASRVPNHRRANTGIEQKFNLADKKEALSKLKNVWLFNANNAEIWSVLLCPALEHLQLDFITQDMPGDIDPSPISKLDKLCWLTLNVLDGSRIEMTTSIINSCHNLTTLELHLADEWFFVAPIHNLLSVSCPHLETLSMTGDYPGEQHPIEDADDRLDDSLPFNCHPNLTHVKFIGCVTDKRLQHLLSRAPIVKSLILDGYLEHLHSSAFTFLLSNGLLKNLENLWFNVSTSVTLTTIKCLILEASELKSIGRIWTIHRAQKEDYNNLRNFVKMKNLDVKLIWVTDQRTLKLH